MNKYYIKFRSESGIVTIATPVKPTEEMAILLDKFINKQNKKEKELGWEEYNTYLKKVKKYYNLSIFFYPISFYKKGN